MSVFIIFISVVATLREYLSSYTSQTLDRCAHIYRVFFFKYTYTGKGTLGEGGGGGGEERREEAQTNTGEGQPTSEGSQC